MKPLNLNRPCSFAWRRAGGLFLCIATVAAADPALALLIGPPILAINRNGNNLTVTVKGAPFASYSFCTSPTGDRAGTWNQTTAVTANASGTASFSDVINPDVPQQFYAAVVGAGGVTGQPISLSASNVYSLNVVGYVNVTCPPGFSLIANPLNTADNNITNVLMDSSIPVLTTFAIFYPGSGFSTYVLDDIDQTWIPSTPTPILAPGGGGFIRNNTATNFTITFVGEVLQGSLVVPIPAGKAIVSSKVPQTGTLNALGFPANPNDLVHVFNNQTGYSSYVFDDIDLVWLPGNPAGPTINVGQAFFAQQVTPKNWIRNFTVQ